MEATEARINAHPGPRHDARRFQLLSLRMKVAQYRAMEFELARFCRLDLRRNQLDPAEVERIAKRMVDELLAKVRADGKRVRTLTVKVRRLGSRTGAVELEIDDQPCGHADLSFFMLMMSSVGPSVGYDHGSAVSTRYRAPFPFSGTLHEVVIQASPERFADTTAAEARAEMGRQ